MEGQDPITEVFHPAEFVSHMTHGELISYVGAMAGHEALYGQKLWLVLSTFI